MLPEHRPLEPITSSEEVSHKNIENDDVVAFICLISCTEASP